MVPQHDLASPRRRVRQCITLTLLATLPIVLGFTLWYRETYWTFPLLGASQRVHWCGRDYEALPGLDLSWRQVAAQGPWPVRIVAVYPPASASQEALLASISPAIVHGSAGQVTSCATMLYTRLGPDRYQPYSLLGGP
jgi:hypothetical protein